MVLAVSFPITALIFWLVRLQGSVAFVWLAFLLTASTATGTRTSDVHQVYSGGT